MKALYITIVLAASCASTAKQLPQSADPGAAVALFVANPSPRWNGLTFRERYYACNAVFIANHVAVTSISCFFVAEEGASRYYTVDMNKIVLETKSERFTVEKILLSWDTNLTFLVTKEKGNPIHFHLGRVAVAVQERLRLVGSSIQGFRQFTELESVATVRAERFGNQHDGEFFIVNSEAAKEARGAALFRKNGEFAGFVDEGGKGGGALVIPADVVLRELQRVMP